MSCQMLHILRKMDFTLNIITMLHIFCVKHILLILDYGSLFFVCLKFIRGISTNCLLVVLLRACYSSHFLEQRERAQLTAPCSAHDMWGRVMMRRGRQRLFTRQGSVGWCTRDESTTGSGASGVACSHEVVVRSPVGFGECCD